MSQHFFYAHDFGTVFQKVCGKTVAQHVGACLALPTDGPEQVLDVVTEGPNAVRLSLFAYEHIASGGNGVACLYEHGSEQVNPFNQGVCDGNDAFLVALAYDAD